MNKDIKKILIVLTLYAFAGGIFYNFEELWLLENNMSIGTVSTILSLCALITVSVIFLSSNIIEQNKLKKFACILISIKTLTLLALFFLYQSNLNVLIKFLIMVDYAVDTEIYACIYPLISIIAKEDKLYAVRGLIYDISFYIGAILVGLFLGKTISIITVSYNTYCIIAAVIMLIAGIFLYTIDMQKYIKDKYIEKNNNDILFRLFKKIKTDKISILYLCFLFFCEISYYSIMGILITILTKELNLTPTYASNLKLITGIIAVGIGTLILAKLTLKNNYINISIKYVVRFISYLIPIFYFSKVAIIIGLFYTRLTSSSYSHVTDAPYINRFDNDEQFAFANLKEMIVYLSRAIGTYLCGYALIRNIKINFIIASVFIVIGTILAYLALYNLNKERSGVK